MYLSNYLVSLFDVNMQYLRLDRRRRLLDLAGERLALQGPFVYNGVRLWSHSSKMGGCSFDVM